MLVGLEVLEVLEVFEVERLIGACFGDVEGASVGACLRVCFDGLDNLWCFGDESGVLR